MSKLLGPNWFFQNAITKLKSKVVSSIFNILFRVRKSNQIGKKVVKAKILLSIF